MAFTGGYKMKKLIGIFICTLLIATVLPASGYIMLDNGSMPHSYENTLFVGGSGPGNYTKIQDAVDNTSNGDTVFVYDDSSPYYERVQINTSISLIGEDRNTTVIDAFGEGFSFFISSDDVNIQEFTIQNSNGLNYAGIGIDFNFGFCTISDNIFIDNDNGIRMVFSGNNNTIEDNYFFNNNDCSITGSHTNNNMILGNTIDHPTGAYPRHGIDFWSFKRNNISGNTINNCDSGIRLNDADYNIVLNNVVSSGERGIDIEDGSNNQIIGNNVSYSFYGGIEIKGDSNDNIIYHNNLEHNYMNALDEGNNTWDDGEYGNYWSDYEEKYPDAKKLRRQGIWDTPYEIPSEWRGNNYDTCPLINQWPDSFSKSVQNNEYVWLSRWLERFPILQKILDVLRLNIR